MTVHYRKKNYIFDIYILNIIFMFYMFMLNSDIKNFIKLS